MKELEKIQNENRELRKTLGQVLTNLENGAFCTVSCSLEFLKKIPEEVKAEVTSLKNRRAAAQAEAWKWETLYDEIEDALHGVVLMDSYGPKESLAECCTRLVKAQQTCDKTTISKLHTCKATPETDRAVIESNGQWSFVLKEKCQEMEIQRNELITFAGELVAAIRINHLRKTFSEATDKDIDQFLQSWSNRLEEIKHKTK